MAKASNTVARLDRVSGASHDSLLVPSSSISFADVAHQTLIFDTAESDASLVLALIDTPWVQRLRNIRQTGNTHLVYMFSEHSRFGHSLGVAYLAITLMRSLRRTTPELVEPYREAVAAAALLHDVGHTAPGSHLAERIWSKGRIHHESVSCEVIETDPLIQDILALRSEGLPSVICGILNEDESLPPWTHSIISGGGWNADRGNWMIVDSALCSVSYGRYNVLALLDAFRLSATGELVLLESRLDALTHFFVARDSMYRQVYQHRVLQAVDALTENIVARLSDLIAEALGEETSVSSDHIRALLLEKNIYCDEKMAAALHSRIYGTRPGLDTIFGMVESWWAYHRDRWCESSDSILSDLATRHRDRKLFKTIRIDRTSAHSESSKGSSVVDEVRAIAARMGFDPRYYVTVIEQADLHRGKSEAPPLVLLDSGKIVPVTEIEPLIAKLFERAADSRIWLAVPKEVKAELGVRR